MRSQVRVLSGRRNKKHRAGLLQATPGRVEGALHHISVLPDVSYSGVVGGFPLQATLLKQSLQHNRPTRPWNLCAQKAPLSVKLESYIIDSIRREMGGAVIRELRLLADEEQFDFLQEALVASLHEAEDVLERHENEPPPFEDTQTLGESAEDYSNLIATQRRRVSALKFFLKEVEK